jgi:hypothetical protein
MNKLSICVMSTLVNDKYKNQILGCMETWGKDAENKNVIVKYFCGDIKDTNYTFTTHLDGVIDDYYSATFKQYYGLKYLLEYHKSEFYLIIGTDTYVNIDRVLNMLNKYDPNYSLIIGGYGQTRHIFNYNVFFSLGGGGIILSHSALTQIEPLFNNFLLEWEEETQKPQYNYLKPACDVSLYHLAWRERVTPIIERDMYSCSWIGDFYDNSNIIDTINIDKIISCHFMEREDMLLYKKWGDKGYFYYQIRQEYAKNPNPILYNFAKKSSKILTIKSNLWVFIYGLINNLETNEREITSVYEDISKYINYSKIFGINIKSIELCDIRDTYDIIFINDLDIYETMKKFLRKDGLIISVRKELSTI